jgi:hypothetical protein
VGQTEGNHGSIAAQSKIDDERCSMKDL